MRIWITNQFWGNSDYSNFAYHLARQLVLATVNPAASVSRVSLGTCTGYLMVPRAAVYSLWKKRYLVHKKFSGRNSLLSRTEEIRILPIALPAACGVIAGTFTACAAVPAFVTEGRNSAATWSSQIKCDFSLNLFPKYFDRTYTCTGTHPRL